MHTKSNPLQLLVCLALVSTGSACSDPRVPTDREQEGQDEVPIGCAEAPVGDGPWEAPPFSCPDPSGESEEQGFGPNIVAADLLSLCPEWDVSYAESAARLLAEGVDERPRFAATDASCALHPGSPRVFYLLTADRTSGVGTWGLFEVSDVLSWRAVTESDLPPHLNVVVLDPSAPGTETTSEGGI